MYKRQVVDDYAHHPNEMKATLTTAREMRFDRILCAFQPHTYTRTKALFPEFVEEMCIRDRYSVCMCLEENR